MLALYSFISEALLLLALGNDCHKCTFAGVHLTMVLSLIVQQVGAMNTGEGVHVHGYSTMQLGI